MVALLAGGVLFAPSAGAHAYLTGSNPADGAALEQAPHELLLHFSESVVLSALKVDLVDSSGQHLDLGAPRLVDPSDAADPGAAGAGPVDTEEPVSISLALPELDAGSYRVSWETISSDDLHRAAGVLVFGVRTIVTATGWVETAPEALESALRWLVLLGIAFGIGAPVARLILRRSAPSLDASSLDRAVQVAAAVGLLGAVLLLLDQVMSSGGLVAPLLAGSYGQRWALRTLGLLVVLVSVRRDGTARSHEHRTRVAQVAGAVLAGVATALLGHSGSGPEAGLTRGLAASVHILSTGCWMGTLTALSLVLLRPRAPAEIVRRVLRAFGPVAATSVGAMAVTGVYLASTVVGSVDALLLTDYGRVLVLKVAVVLGSGALALSTRRRLRRGGPLGVRGVRVLLAEVVGGGLVLLLTGVLSSGQPALERQLTTDSSQTPASTSRSQQLDDLQVSLVIQPNLPGQNMAVVRVNNTRRPAPGQITSVVLGTASAAEPVQLTSIGDDQWSAPLSLTESGPSAVRLDVTRDGLASSTGQLPWTVGWPKDAARPLVSRAPIGPLLVRASLLGVVLLALGLLLALRRAATGPTRRAGPKRVRSPGDRAAPPGRRPPEPQEPPFEPDPVESVLSGATSSTSADR